MYSGFDNMQKMNQANMDAAVKSMTSVSKGIQAIAVEYADFSKKSFEDGTAAMEKLMGAKTLDKAFEVQSAYAKTTYEAMMGQASKMGEMYADLAKDVYKPLEDLLASTGKK